MFLLQGMSICHPVEHPRVRVSTEVLLWSLRRVLISLCGECEVLDCRGLKIISVVLTSNLPGKQRFVDLCCAVQGDLWP